MNKASRFVEDQGPECERRGCYKDATRTHCGLNMNFCSIDCQNKEINERESENELERIAEITSGGQS